MTDMSYSIGCTFAEIDIFITAIDKKYSLVYIVREEGNLDDGHFQDLAQGSNWVFLNTDVPMGVDDNGFCGAE